MIVNDLYPNLPEPQILEELDYEQILSEMMVSVKSRFVVSGIDYDVGNLETDPVKIALEEVAYREVGFRARANDVAKAQILPFSTGSDLDYLGNFHEVPRLSGELDKAYHYRIQIGNKGKSPGGPEDWYKFHALSSDVRVKDATVDLIGKGPKLMASVLSTDNGGVADQPLLDAVFAALNASDVRVTNDVISVQPAVLQIVDIEYDIYLLSGQPISIYDALEETLITKWDDDQSMGFDLNHSWITKTLHQPGVQRVEPVEPVAPVIAGPDRAISIGTVTLNFKGYDF